VVLVASGTLVLAQVDPSRLDSEFKAAVAAYEGNNLAEAARRLQFLAAQAPDTYEVQELLGVVLSAQSKESEATLHFEHAVRLRPDSAEARTNLATNLMRSGNSSAAEIEFKKAVALNSQDYDANHNLGEFYIQANKISVASGFLEKAQKIKPDAYDNGYDLALAYLDTGHFAQARSRARDLLQIKNTAEVHNLLAQVEEKDGNFVAAANEFETAAHMDPSESNLFDWGSELLLHHTLDPAIDVFRHAAELHPRSPRIATGLGMALYSRGNYDDAVKALLKATDLSPQDPRPYYFLSKAYDSSPAQADEVISHFRRFAEQEPKNARALYYYALSLWKGKRLQDSTLDIGKVESLLKNAVALDPKFAEARLQLGNLYSDQGKYREAIPQYEEALAINSGLADGHYRLGQAYVHTGQKDRAQKELGIYQQLRAQHMADLDKQRAEIRQFVYSSKDNSARQ
jgi:tetratricopeptide (TPR) repeat protein